MMLAFAGTTLAAIVSGKVSDSSSQPLAGVSVRLIQYPDSVRKGFATTGATGKFSISKVKPGNYALIFTMVGMDEVVKSFVVADTTRRVEFNSIVMTETATMLSEAVVTGVKAAVVAKQDTMEFNAGSYKTQANSTVEDLLKKLPGVEVSSDGSITSGGKSITKILVDGKEFFGDDPTTATKNLPSDLVEKVQVVDRKSDLARITGVDDGEEETVINLTVKKSMKNGWFGRFGGGYGTDGRYEGMLNLSTFTDTNQISLIGGANNTNNLGFGDGGRGRFMNFGPSGGINTSQRLGLNFNLGKTEKFRVGGNVFYSHSDRSAESTTDQQEMLTEMTAYNKQESSTRDQGHNVRAHFRMEWKIDDYNTLDFRPEFSFNSRYSELSESSFGRRGADLSSLVDINERQNKRFNHGTSYNAGGRLIFNHNFKSKPGRSFSVQANYSFSDTKQHTTTWNDIVYFLENDQNDEYYRYIDNHQWNNSVSGRFTWTEPLGDVKRGNFLQIAYNMRYSFNNSDKGTYDIPLPENMAENMVGDFTNIPGGSEFNEDLSNSFRNKFMTQELQVGYKKVNKNYNLETGLILSPSSSASRDLINSERNIDTRWVWNVAPFLRFRYRFSKTKSLRVDYRARTSSPSLTQLQPVPDVSDPTRIVVGNPDLDPTFTQSLNIHFNNYNTETQQSIFTMARFQYATNVIVNRTSYVEGTGNSTTTYENANGNFSGWGMFMLNQPLRNRKWRFNVRSRLNYSTSPGYINDKYNRTGNFSIAPNVGMTFTCDVFQMSVNPSYSFSMTTSTLKGQENRYVHTYGFNADASLYLPFGLELNTDISFDKNSGYSSGFNVSQWIWNAQISYSLLRDKSLTLSARAYDLLGQMKSVSRTSSGNMITDTRTNNLGRYFMFGISYTFNTMKNKGKKGDFNGMPGHFPGGPMGPPPGGGRRRM